MLRATFIPRNTSGMIRRVVSSSSSPHSHNSFSRTTNVSSSSSSSFRVVSHSSFDLTSSTAFLLTASAAAVSQARAFSSTPPLFASKNPYKLLKIPQGASVKDIKAAHRKMSMMTHPDRPGGSHEKFQEVQEAYEQIKTGTWIPKDGVSGGKEGNNNMARWQGLRYKTASRDTASFDDVMRDLHSKNGGPSASAADEPVTPEGEEPKKQRFNPQDIRIQAWFRLLTLWAIVFLSLRVVLFLFFPPKVEKKNKPNPALLHKSKAPPPPPRLPGGNAPQAMH